MAEPFSDETNPTISLSQLRKGDKKSVSIACSALSKDGFIFLDLMDDPLSNIRLDDAATFLESNAGKGSTQELHGHVSNVFKDSLRLLTGNQYQASNSPVDLELDAMEMDKAAIEVAATLAKPLFGCDSVKELGKVYDLPLLMQEVEGSSSQRYGLLDIVRYHNNDSRAPAIVVSAHKDPGLFVISLPQSAPGLELQDHEGKWHEPPPGLGVLWMGVAASDCARPCLHRVRTHHGNARVGCWHEVCTSSQLAQPMLDRLQREERDLQMGGIVGTEKVLNELRRAENHEATVAGEDLPSSSEGEQLRIVEVPPRGVPMLKVEQATFRFPVRTSHKRPADFTSWLFPKHE